MVDYALALKASNSITSPDFVVTPAMRDELYRRMKSRGAVVDRATYDAAAPLVNRLLAAHITRFVFGTQEEFARGLREDSTLAKARQLLQGAGTPKDLLKRAKK